MGIRDMIQCPKILEDDAVYEGNSKFYKKNVGRVSSPQIFKEGFI
jgi:hypothetical protein